MLGVGGVCRLPLYAGSSHTETCKFLQAAADAVVGGGGVAAAVASNLRCAATTLQDMPTVEDSLWHDDISEYFFITLAVHSREAAVVV